MVRSAAIRAYDCMPGLRRNHDQRDHTNARTTPTTAPAGNTPTATPSGPTTAVSISTATGTLGSAPTSISIKVGTTVIWTNTTSAPHTVTSDDGTTFDSGIN